jgi:hypothetical protein
MAKLTASFSIVPILLFFVKKTGLVATPLWIAFHMTPDGDGFASDKVTGGYGIILEAALRPVLIVFGLMFAFLMMWPIMDLFSKMFVMATDAIDQGVGFSLMAGAAGGGAAAGAIGSGAATVAAGATGATAASVAAAGSAAILAAPIAIGAGAVVAAFTLNMLIAKLIYLVFYVMLSYIIIDKCCDVIDILPANVMRWVNIHAGAGNSNLENDMHTGVAALKSDTRYGMAEMGKPKKDSGGNEDKRNPGTNPSAPGTDGGKKKGIPT